MIALSIGPAAAAAPTLFTPAGLPVHDGTNWVGLAIAGVAFAIGLVVLYFAFAAPRRSSPSERALRALARRAGMTEGDKRTLARLASIAGVMPAALLVVPSAFRTAAERLVQDDPKALGPVGKLAKRVGLAA